MATATAKKETVVTGVTLELSKDEAEALNSLLGNYVFGSGPVRSKLDNIFHALTAQSIPSRHPLNVTHPRYGGAGVHFTA